MSPVLRIIELEQHNAQLSGQSASVSSQFATLTTAFTALSANHAALKKQLDWFKRQLFGQKSEKQLAIEPQVQGNLLAGLAVQLATPLPPIPTETVTYQRKKLRDNSITDTGLRFDASVPVHEITIGDPAMEALPSSEREIIGEKVTYRLAQRPSGYEVIKYIQRVYKRRASGEIVATITPPAVLEKCVADVSLLAGMLIDKFQYHRVL